MLAGPPPLSGTGEPMYHAKFGRIIHQICKADADVPLAFMERDPVDLAIEWSNGEKPLIPVIMPAHDKRPGGDWETGMY